MGVEEDKIFSYDLLGYKTKTNPQLYIFEHQDQTRPPIVHLWGPETKLDPHYSQLWASKTKNNPHYA